MYFSQTSQWSRPFPLEHCSQSVKVMQTQMLHRVTVLMYRHNLARLRAVINHGCKWHSSNDSFASQHNVCQALHAGSWGGSVLKSSTAFILQWLSPLFYWGQGWNDFWTPQSPLLSMPSSNPPSLPNIKWHGSIESLKLFSKRPRPRGPHV